ncbi:TPA: hypothetical protein H1005_00375 [archaeon]|nr:hypothetical protein [Candidatus Naiadarchaeales archaeon SRR2090153.bin1042]
MEKLRALIIIEILGKPPEHVKTALETIVSRLSAEKGVKILEKTLHEPVPVPDSQTLFTSFAEIEFEVETIETLFGIVFVYMPAHIEIIKPEKITLANTNLTDIINSLAEKLHNYDAIAKRLVVDRDELLKKLYEVAPHLFQKASKEAVAQLNSEIKETKKETTVKKTKTKRAKKN